MVMEVEDTQDHLDISMKSSGSPRGRSGRIGRDGSRSHGKRGGQSSPNRRGRGGRRSRQGRDDGTLFSQEEKQFHMIIFHIKNLQLSLDQNIQ